MALNKLKLGTALSTQIAEQNANIEQIESHLADLETLINDLGTIKKQLRNSIPSNSSIEIGTDGSRFVYLVAIQGNTGQAYGTFILQGYGPGTDSRFTVSKIGAGTAISVSIVDQSFVISNPTLIPAECNILSLLGPLPSIS